jgi:hypothetical protein
MPASPANHQSFVPGTEPQAAQSLVRRRAVFLDRDGALASPRHYLGTVALRFLV